MLFGCIAAQTAFAPASPDTPSASARCLSRTTNQRLTNVRCHSAPVPRLQLPAFTNCQYTDANNPNGPATLTCTYNYATVRLMAWRESGTDIAAGRSSHQPGRSGDMHRDEPRSGPALPDSGAGSGLKRLLLCDRTISACLSVAQPHAPLLHDLSPLSPCVCFRCSLPPFFVSTHCRCTFSLFANALLSF